MRKFTLRLPDDLGEAAEKTAETNTRSLNEEIVYALRYYLDMLERRAKSDKAFAEMRDEEQFWVWVNPRQWEYLQEALEFAKGAGFSKIDES